MMPITPMGVATRAMSSPLGRVQRASSRPTGSGSAATSSTPLAMASMRASFSASRSSSAAAMSPALAASISSALAARISLLRGADRGGGIAQRLGLGARRRLRAWRAPHRGRAAPSASISAARASFPSCDVHDLLSVRSAPDRRDGSSRPGHDSPEWPRFRRCACRRCARHPTHYRPPGPRAISRPSLVLDQHRVAALEAAIDLADAGGQQALAVAPAP